MAKSSHLGLGALEKWDIATTSKFLKLYRNHKCLWDHTDPNYKDKNQRNTSLEEISNSMALPGFDTRYVVLKIRALRSTYIYERRKVRQRLKNGEKFQTHLGWYHLADSFLRNYVVEKTYSGNTEELNKYLPPPRIITEDSTAVSTKGEPLTGTIYKDEINTTNTTQQQMEFYSTTSDAKSEMEFTLVEEQDDEIDDDDDDFITEQEQKPAQIVQTFVPSLKRRNSNKNKNIKNVITTIHEPQQQPQLQQQPQQQQQQQQPQQQKNNFTNSIDNKPQFITIESASGTTNNNNNTYLRDDDDNEDEFETFAKSVAMQLKKIPKEDAYGLQVQFQYLLSQAKLKAMGKSTSIILTDSQNFLSFK